MEDAKAAMERVVLLPADESSDRDGVSAGGPRGGLLSGALPSRALSSARSLFSRALHWAAYRLGYMILRVLSLINLGCAIFGGVAMQQAAYYYRGVLSFAPMIAAMIYAPALGAVAVLREAMRRHGRSRSGFSARRNSTVDGAYIGLLISAVLSVAQPLVMSVDGAISTRSMWVALAGSAWFFYCILVSEVLFAGALSIDCIRREGLREESAEKDESVNSAQYQSI